MIGVKKSPPIEDGRGGRKNSGVRGGATRVQMTRWREEKQKKTKKQKCLTNVDKPRIPRNYDRRHQSGFPSLRSSPRFIHALSKKKKKKKSDQQTRDFRRFSISLMYGGCVQLK